MKLEVEHLRLESAHPFRIARGTRSEFSTIVARLLFEGTVGLGEASPQAYYGETPESALRAFAGVASKLDGGPEDVSRRLNGSDGDLALMLAPHASVRAAVDIALWDLRGKLAGRACCDMVGANRAKTPLTSFTIGFDSLDEIDRKVDEAGAFDILKVKMGLPGDIEVLDRVRARSGKKIRVDANEGWGLEMAIQKTTEMFERGIEFVEQPISHEDEEGLRELKRLSPLPVILDESVVGPGDALRRRDQGHGINIKLMKCGGITPALALIREARANGLSVMLGCMVETSIGVTAAAHLSPLVDYADLDGNLLLADDPYGGVRVVDGRLVLPDGDGLGVYRRAATD